MKIIIQAAGYGTRLLKELKTLADNPLASVTKTGLGVAKALIPIQGKPIIQHQIEQLTKAEVPLNDIFIVTNKIFFPLFLSWAKKNGFPIENIINNGSSSNDQRLGSNRDILLVIKQKQLADDHDLLILAGDTLYPKLDLKKFLEGCQNVETGVISYYFEPDREIMKKRGNLIIKNQQLIDFVEKPLEAVSQFAFPSLNFLKAPAAKLLPNFLKEVPDLKINDGHGFFLQWLLKRGFKLKALQIPGRFDLGSIRDLKRANQEYQP
ncbi:MAG TPA: NDP-sugar synthase [Patescibacteria group bacterium]|nr:NDP-sugar synthase [Patescibacteria group bacterium]